MRRSFLGQPGMLSGIVVLCAFCILWAQSAWAVNSVVVESKVVPPGQSAVTLGVYVDNDVDIAGLVIPLEIREINSGSFISGSFSVTEQGRLAASGLMGYVYRGFFDTPSGTNSCSGPVSQTWAVRTRDTVPAGFFSNPDAVMWVGLATVPAGRMAAGSDSLPPSGVPSLLFTFEVTSDPGAFEIDTCCTTSANHLVMTDVNAGPIVPGFTKGVVTIAGELAFFAVPRIGDPPLVVFFSGVDLIGMGMDSWSWDFGNGGTPNPADDVQNPVHTYTSPGTYTVSLTAWRGATPYMVTRPAYIQVNPLRADFSATPRGGGKPLTVSFTDQSTGVPTGWAWDFGDNTPPTAPEADDQNPTHDYTASGWYDVSLTVSNAGGSDTKLALHFIRVDDVATPDLVVMAYGRPRPRPGFEKCYYLGVQDLGTGSTTGNTVQLEFPPLTTYLSSTPPGTVVNNTVNWITGPLPPGDPPVRYVACVLVPAGTPLGTPLTATATIGVAPGEIVVANNVDEEDETVGTSVDPNDLVVSPRGCGPDKNLIQGTPSLSYTIFFENKPEATAEAIYVLVVDTLDPDLDWGTLQVGPTIKDAVLSFDFDPVSGEALWFFDGINLPPNVNPPEGEGFVAYTIQPKAGLPDGTVISSRAHIRFDYENWLAAPDAGPLDLTVSPCPCTCNCHADPQCDHSPDVLDVVQTINVAFRGFPAVLDPNGNCPFQTTDVDCSGDTGVLDVVHMINVAFRGMNAATEFCNPCP